MNQSRTNRLDHTQTGSSDLAQSSLVLQRGYSLSLSHRLTPLQTLSATLSQQQSRGDQISLATDLKSLTLNWNGRLGPRSTLQLGLRHSDFDSASRSYRENAVFATFVQQF